jgi:hypothetical protein
MNIGHPLPIGILEHKLVPDGLGGFEFDDIVSGNPDAALVEFDPGSTEFTAKQAGKYLVIWNSETKRQNISIAVTAPAAAAISRNSNTWRKIVNDQLMSIAFSFSSGWSVSSYVVQTREYMPFEHVSHSFLVELDDNETCVLAVTSTETDRQWSLAAWRIPTATQQYRPNANLLVGAQQPPNTVSSDITQTRVSESGAYIGRYRFECTAGTGKQVRFLATPQPGYAVVAKIRLFVDATDPSPAGGSVVLSIKKNATTIVSSTVTIPDDGTVVQISHSFSNTDIVLFDAIWLDITGIDSPERFEIEATVDVV